MVETAWYNDSRSVFITETGTHKSFTSLFCKRTFTVTFIFSNKGCIWVSWKGHICLLRQISLQNGFFEWKKNRFVYFEQLKKVLHLFTFAWCSLTLSIYMRQLQGMWERRRLNSDSRGVRLLGTVERRRLLTISSVSAPRSMLKAPAAPRSLSGS